MPTASTNHGPRLSVAMIVRNARQAAFQTLQSVRSIADQIVVIDVGSTDGTPEALRAFDLTLRQHPWTHDFSAARNLALQQVTGQWILWLEPGETLTPENAAKLRKFVQSAEPRTDCAYQLVVELPPAAPYQSGEQVARVRLIPNRPGLTFTGRVRESLLPALQQAEINLVALPLSILRPVSDHDRHYKRENARLDLELSELEMSSGDPRPEALLAWAEAQVTLGADERAAEVFRRLLTLSTASPTLRLEGYYGLMTVFDRHHEQREQQITACLEALEAFPLDAQLLCALGNYMLAQNRADLAVRAYTICVAHGHLDPCVWHLSDLGQVSVGCLSLAQQLTGDDQAAGQTLEAGLARYPESERLRRQLINLHVKRLNRNEAYSQFDQLSAETPHRDALRQAVRGALLAVEKNWAAALADLEKAYQAGCHDPLCCHYLAETYLAVGQGEAAEQVLRRWLEQEPDSREVQTYLAMVESQAIRHSQTAQHWAAKPQSGPARRLRVDPARSEAAERSAPDRPLPHLAPSTPSTPASETV